MDDVTARVRAMYEKYPYPTKPRGIVSDVHPQLMLSYLEGPLPERALRVLDAGCGTGTASLGTAMCNPEAEVTAIDLNRSALKQVREEQKELNLANLQVLEANLMTHEGLHTPAGGFDVIFCSGVLHHLSDPAPALQKLRDALAPRGVLRLMVYGRPGRHGLYRFVEALDAVHPERDELERRLALGRRLMNGLGTESPATQPPWDFGSKIDDVEFVDRYLNLNDRSYTVAELLELVRGAGLQALRWYEPRHWALESVCNDRFLVRELSALPKEQIWTVVELLSNRPQLDLILCHPEAKPATLQVDQLALSPQTSIRVSQRVAGGKMMQYHATVSVREGAERALSAGEKLILDQFGPGAITLAQLQQSLSGRMNPGTVRSEASRLLQEELLYRPPG